MMNDMMTVGELLKAARETRALSIESVAKEICVSRQYLRDIEAGRYDALPEMTFSLGFVRAYAGLLKLESGDIVARFKDEFQACRTEAPSRAPLEPMADRPSRRLPGWMMPFAGIVGVSMCWSVLGSNLDGFTTAGSTSAYDVSAEMQDLAKIKASLAGEASKGEATPVKTSAADGAGLSLLSAAGGTGSYFNSAANASGDTSASRGTTPIRLEAVEDAWVRLENADGSEIWSGVLREGESYRPQFINALLLTTSNAGALLVSQDGGVSAPVGKRGEIVSDLRLETTLHLSGNTEVTG